MLNTSKHLGTPWKDSILSTSSMQYFWKATESLWIFIEFSNQLRMTSLRACAVFLVGRGRGSKKGEWAKNRICSGLFGFFFNSYDILMSNLIGFSDSSCLYFFNFFGVCYRQFWLTTCKLVKKSYENKTNQNFFLSFDTI